MKLQEQKCVVEWREVIRLKLDGASFVESRLMGVEVLPRLMARLQTQACECKQCASYFAEMKLIIEDLRRVVEPVNIAERSSFEHATEVILSHFKREHKVYPKGKMVALVLTFGMIVGIIIGAVCAFYLNIPFTGALMLGWLGGLILGYVVGKVVEFQLVRDNRLF